MLHCPQHNGNNNSINSISSFLQRSAALQYVRGLRGRGLIWTTQINIIGSQILTKVSYNIFRTIYFSRCVTVYPFFWNQVIFNLPWSAWSDRLISKFKWYSANTPRLCGICLLHMLDITHMWRINVCKTLNYVCET